MTLKLLPLSLYVEKHGLLVLLSTIRGVYDLVITEIAKAVETTRQAERIENRISKTRNNKTNNKFFRRTKLLSTTFLELRMIMERP